MGISPIYQDISAGLDILQNFVNTLVGKNLDKNIIEAATFCSFLHLIALQALLNFDIIFNCYITISLKLFTFFLSVNTQYLSNLRRFKIYCQCIGAGCTRLVAVF